ncbi:MAG: thiamine diphosphokinase [Clostridiales bacterium]|nr:thiamine diphosphokinase [Clostridiales bacterium]
MCIVVIAGGPNKDLSLLLPFLRTAEKIVCADSGADSLRPYGILPDEVWGDMDSISQETREWIETNQIRTSVFPVEKDMTDAEICLRSVPKDKKILFVTSILGRIDHVMTNMLLVMRLAQEGRSITLTDGTTWVYPLHGACRWYAPESLLKNENTCSLIPLGQGAKGVSAVGMKYGLSDQDLIPGSSLTVSNEFDLIEKEHGFIMKDGTMLVIVTPKS